MILSIFVNHIKPAITISRSDVLWNFSKASAAYTVHPAETVDVYTHRFRVFLTKYLSKRGRYEGRGFNLGLVEYESVWRGIVFALL
jgi:hypothetical protein